MPARIRIPSRSKVSEAHIQQTCSEWLALDGWRRIRTDLKHLRGLGVQEPGMADDLYIRYLSGREVVHAAPGGEVTFPGDEVLWIEWKRRKGKAALHQKEWHCRERGRGALTWIAGDDFEASIEGFMEFYQNSGFARNVRKKRTVQPGGVA